VKKLVKLLSDPFCSKFKHDNTKDEWKSPAGPQLQHIFLPAFCWTWAPSQFNIVTNEKRN